MKKVVRLYLKQSSKNSVLKTVVTDNGGKIAKKGKYDVIIFDTDCGIAPILDKLLGIDIKTWTQVKTNLTAIGYDIAKESASEHGLRDIQPKEEKVKDKKPKSVDAEPTPVPMAEPTAEKAEIPSPISEEITIQAE